MDERYTGPYIITKCYGKGIYSLQEVADPSNVIFRVSGAQLKPHIDQPDEYVSNYPLDDSILPLPPQITRLTSLNNESETSSFDEHVSCLMIIWTK